MPSFADTTAAERPRVVVIGQETAAGERLRNEREKAERARKLAVRVRAIFHEKSTGRGGRIPPPDETIDEMVRRLVDVFPVTWAKRPARDKILPIKERRHWRQQRQRSYALVYRNVAYLLLDNGWPTVGYGDRSPLLTIVVSVLEEFGVHVSVGGLRKLLQRAPLSLKRHPYWLDQRAARTRRPKPESVPAN